MGRTRFAQVSNRDSARYQLTWLSLELGYIAQSA